jgi:hypothetical protein
VKNADLQKLFGKYGEVCEIFIDNKKSIGFVRMDFRHKADQVLVTRVY